MLAKQILSFSDHLTIEDMNHNVTLLMNKSFTAKGSCQIPWSTFRRTFKLEISHKPGFIKNQSWNWYLGQIKTVIKRQTSA